MAQTIFVATEFYRPMPQIHEPWAPVYTNFLAYKMAKSERIPLWFKVTSSGPATLALGGANASDFTAEFFKPYGQVVNNSDAFRRASFTTSPQGTYFDPLNPIPTGANNFVPEVPDGEEIVYLLLSCKSTATSGVKTITVTLGTETITMTIRVWGNVTIPASPVKPILVNLTSGTANRGVNGGYISDAKTLAATNDVTDLLVKYRTTPYMNGIVFLAVSAGKLNIDNLSANGTSYRQMVLNRIPAASPKLWMSMPQTQAAHRTLAYAQAAEATIAAEGLTNMAVYIWDEPSSDQATAAAIKSTLDNWKAGSPSTKLILTTTRDYFTLPGPIAAGMTLAYLASLGTQIVLTPVINQVGGSFSAVGSYPNGAFSFYSACQENCGPTTNGNATGGHDTGYADLAYIDMPMIRRYAIMLLAMRSTWVDKTAWLLHYDSTQNWNQFSGTLSASGQNPWLSARRFNVMGDGTFVYPAIPGWKPHVGIPAFVTASPAGVPSLRLLYLAHASFMADLFQAYLTAQASNQADNLVTSPTVFSTNYEAYESLRDKIGTALEGSTTIAPGADPIKTVIPVVVVPPPDPVPDPPPVVPVPDPGNPTPPPVIPDPVVPPPLPPPPVIPLPPVEPDPPVSGGDVGAPEPDLPGAIPLIIEGVSGQVSVIHVAPDACYVALSNTLKKFSKYSEQYSLGVLSGDYMQIPVDERLTDRVLSFAQSLYALPPVDSQLIDFFTTGSTEANYGNGVRTRGFFGAAAIADGMLDVRGTTAAARFAYYGTSIFGGGQGLCPLAQTGTIRQLFIPNYTGVPGIASSWGAGLFIAGIGPSTTANALYLYHTAAGVLTFKVYDSTGANSITAAATWAPVAGTKYVVDATFDLDQGLVEIWINGIFIARQFGVTTYTRADTIDRMSVGGDFFNGEGFNTGNHQVEGIMLFDTYRAWDKWVMMGTPVGERFCMLSYNLTYSPLSDEQGPYRGPGSSDGGMNL